MTGRAFAPIAVLVAFVIAFASFARFAPDGLKNGDAVEYGRRIENCELGSITVHRGYFALCIAFTRAWPGDGDRELNLFACACSAGAIVLAFASVLALTRRHSAAAFAALALFAIPEFAANAATAEVYSAQLVLFLLGVLVMLRGRALGRERPIAAGLAFGAAALVTPSSALAAPSIVLLAKRPRTWLIVGVVAALMVAASALPSLDDWLFGDRGLLLAKSRSMGVLDVLAKERGEIGAAWVLAPFVGLAVLRARREPDARALVLAAAASWIVTLLVGERFSDVPVQLPTWALFALAAGVGFAEALDRARGRRLVVAAVSIAGAAALAFAGAGSVRELAHQARRIEKYKELCSEIAARAARDAIPCGLWSRCVLFEHYRGRDGEERELLSQANLDGTNGDDARARESARLDEALARGRQLWLVSSPAPEDVATILRAGYSITPFRSVFVAERTPR